MPRVLAGGTETARGSGRSSRVGIFDRSACCPAVPSPRRRESSWRRVAAVRPTRPELLPASSPWRRLTRCRTGKSRDRRRAGAPRVLKPGALTTGSAPRSGPADPGPRARPLSFRDRPPGYPVRPGTAAASAWVQILLGTAERSPKQQGGLRGVPVLSGVVRCEVQKWRMRLSRFFDGLDRRQRVALTLKNALGGLVCSRPRQRRGIIDGDSFKSPRRIVVQAWLSSALRPEACPDNQDALSLSIRSSSRVGANSSVQ